jgi:repressor LexA
MAKGLTRRQQEIYEFLIEYTEEKGFPPTLREICGRFGMASTRAASDHLEALERKGYVDRSPDLSRAIRFPNRPAHRPGRSVPLVGKIAAGSPILAVENIVDRVTLDESIAKTEGSFMLEVQGESMIGAHILPGDFIVVKPQDDAQDGDIVVAMLGDEATVKKLERKGSRIRLMPENPAMDPVPIPSPSELRILGIVTGLVRRIR